MARRAWGIGAGILVAGVVVLLVDLVWDAPDSLPGAGLYLSLLLVCGAAGLAVVEIWRPGTVDDGPRTARVTAPELGDYLPRAVRAGAAAYTGLGLVAVAATLLLTRSPWFDTATILWSPVPVLAVAIPGLILLTRLAVLRVLDVAQPARDEHELYWQDAVRAQTLSSLVAPTPLVGVLALVVCGTVLDDAASAAAVAQGAVGPGWSLAILLSGYALPFVLVVLGLLVTIGPWSTTTAQHVRDRLWGGRPPAATQEQAGV